MKEDVPFKTMGEKVKRGVIVMYVQTTLGDFWMTHLEGKYIRAYKALIRELSAPNNSDTAEFQEAYAEIKKCLNMK